MGLKDEVKDKASDQVGNKASDMIRVKVRVKESRFGIRFMNGTISY